MPDYLSSSIYFTGLGNGTDFDELVLNLKKIELRKAQQLGRWKNDWQTKLDAFSTLREQLANLSSMLKTMNSVDKFLVKNAVSSNASAASATAGLEALEGTYNIEVGQIATNSYASINLGGISSTSDVINNTGANQDLVYNYKGTDYTVVIPPGTTLSGLSKLINDNKANPGVRMTLLPSGNSGYVAQLYSMDQGAGSDIAINLGATTSPLFNDSSIDPAEHWVLQAGQNAEVRINGWPTSPGWYSVSSNSLQIGGLNLNLHSAGATTITVNVDKAKIKENVEKFVEAMNGVRSTLLSMTKVDSSKSTVTSDYANSQFETQKGSVLTGNYGVQLLSSKLKSAVMDQARGFDYFKWTDASQTEYTGDILSSIAQLGIKTDSVEGSATFGLLVFDNTYGMPRFDDMLETDPYGVAELFAANKQGVSESPTDFAYAGSMLQTKGGKYNVYYEVDASGDVIESTARINGKQAKYDPATRQLYLVRIAGTPDENDADGIMLTLLNTSPGATVSGVVRVKQGKLSELCEVIDNDILEPDSGSSDTHKGTLSILETQYQAIIDNITKKIAQEDERIIKLERLTRLRFSRLEATLKRYEGLQTQLENQLKQLNTDSNK